MARDHRRTPTLSISLTPELAEAVSSRVATGLYTSASELIREALRLLLKLERAQESRLGDGPESLAAERFAAAMELFDFGRGVQVRKIRNAEPDLSSEELQQRLADLSDAQEGDEFLRKSPERLAKLKLYEPS